MRALAKKGEVKIETFHCNALFKWNRGQIYKKNTKKNNKYLVFIGRQGVIHTFGSKKRY